MVQSCLMEPMLQDESLEAAGLLVVLLVSEKVPSTVAVRLALPSSLSLLGLEFSRSCSYVRRRNQAQCSSGGWPSFAHTLLLQPDPQWSLSASSFYVRSWMRFGFRYSPEVALD